MASKEINKEFSNLGLRISRELGKALIEQGHEATGALINSFEWTIKGDSLIVSGNKYWEVVNDGARFSGKQPPISALVKWVRAKGISDPNKTTRQIAFAIAQSIKKDGLQRNWTKTMGKTKEARMGFVEKALEIINRDIDEVIARATQKTVEVSLDKIPSRVG